jgi:hypothetical protein
VSAADILRDDRKPFSTTIHAVDVSGLFLFDKTLARKYRCVCFVVLGRVLLTHAAAARSRLHGAPGTVLCDHNAAAAAATGRHDAEQLWRVLRTVIDSALWCVPLNALTGRSRALTAPAAGCTRTGPSIRAAGGSRSAS